MTNLTPSLGENLARIRKERGLTQQQLADKAGLVRATVVRVEKGSDPPASTVQALADALDVATNVLLPRKPPRRTGHEKRRYRRTG